MSIFSRVFGSKSEPAATGQTVTPTNPVEDIPENVFIEKNEPAKQTDVIQKPEIKQDNIQALYEFLGTDFQQQGYNDALVNPDTSYMKQNIESILSDLEMTIKKVLTFYEDAIKELDFLIGSRGRLGMVDTVDELQMKKERGLRHMEKVIEMRSELDGEKRESHRVTISYKRGFHNGMAAIAHHESNKRSF